MSVPAQPVLYDFWRASSAWRVRLALNLKGIAYETRSINLFADENKSEAYRKVQPFGAVPAFIDNRGDGRVLIESVAILEYLEETRSETPLLPKDPVDRAAVRALVLAFGMDIQPLCSIRVAKHLGQDKAGDWSKYWMSEGFAAVEKILEKSAGKYSFGDTLTMADIFLVPQFAIGVNSGLDMTPYPIMSRVNATLGELDAFKAAHPKQQPDCPPEMR